MALAARQQRGQVQVGARAGRIDRGRLAALDGPQDLKLDLGADTHAPSDPGEFAPGRQAVQVQVAAKAQRVQLLPALRDNARTVSWLMSDSGASSKSHQPRPPGDARSAGVERAARNQEAMVRLAASQVAGAATSMTACSPPGDANVRRAPSPCSSRLRR